MTRYLFILPALSSMFWFCSFLALAIYFIGCKSPAPVEPVTEQPREPRPVPVAPHSAYVPYTNSQQDRLVERHELIGPPVVPNHGPFPLILHPRAGMAVSNWMTKAMGVQPKPMVTNQIKGSTILTKITTIGSDGKPFTAELTLEGEQTVRAGAKMSVVIFAIHHPNFVIEVCTNLNDATWYPMTSGTGSDTNSAVVLIDLHGGSKPIQFYRQKAAP